MACSIEIAEAAEKDIRDALLWHEDQKENLGSRFENYVNKAIDSIQSNPLKTQVRYSNTRVFYLDKVPEDIQFQVKENHILIVAVFHTWQDPEKWTVREQKSPDHWGLFNSNWIEYSECNSIPKKKNHAYNFSLLLQYETDHIENTG